MSASPEGKTNPASICRRIVRQSATAALATIERGAGTVLRLDFHDMVSDGNAARRELIRLVKDLRSGSGGG